MFIQEDVIYRHRIFQRIVINREGEFKGEVVELLNKQRIDRVQVSTYYILLNRIIKQRYRPLKDILLKLRNEQIENLIVVLFIEQITIYKPINYIPFYIVYSKELILLVKSQFLIQRTLFIEKIIDRVKLIKLRVRQF